MNSNKNGCGLVLPGTQEAQDNGNGCGLVLPGTQEAWGTEGIPMEVGMAWCYQVHRRLRTMEVGVAWCYQVHRKLKALRGYQWKWVWPGTTRLRLHKRLSPFRALSGYQGSRCGLVLLG